MSGTQAGIDVVLKVKHSAYREVIRPIIDYVRELRKENPRTVVAVYIPQYVVGRWWEQLLHNQTALRLKSRLLFMPGVMVISVPYQLSSSAIGPSSAPAGSTSQTHAGDVRRGPVASPASSPGSSTDRRGARCSDARLVRRRRSGRPRRALRGPRPGGRRALAGVVVFVRHAIPGETVVARSPRARPATGSCAATPWRS